MVESRLAAMGIKLPKAPAPLASYVPAKEHRGVLMVSGQLPFLNGELMAVGSVPVEVTAERAHECARQCALNALAAVHEKLGSLDRLMGVIKLSCFVACEPGFGGQPAIANGASDLLFELMGEQGRHARAAVGTTALPMNAPVEIEFMFELIG